MSGAAQLTAGALAVKQFSLALDGASMSVSGTVGEVAKFAALELQVNVEVTRTAGLATFTGLKLGALPAFTASARLTDGTEGYAITALKLASTAATVTGDVALTRGPKRLKVSMKLQSALLDASALAQPAATGSSRSPTATGARAIADLALPVDALRAIDADVELRIDSVKFDGATPLGPVLLRALIADGRLKAEPMQLPATEASVDASATVDAEQAVWELRLDGKDLDLGAMTMRLAIRA